MHLGTGVRVVATEKIYTQGNLTQTGNALDVAVNGRGFFQILMPDGTTAYTRDGSFQVSAQGEMVTSSGYCVQPGISIPDGAQSVTIGARRRGHRAARRPAERRRRSGRCSSSTSSIPPACSRAAKTCWPKSAASGPAQTGTPGLNGLGMIEQGSVEASNVNVVEELVNMIETQRAYEMNSKAISTTDQMLEYVNQPAYDEACSHPVMLSLLIVAAAGGCATLPEDGGRDFEPTWPEEAVGAARRMPGAIYRQGTTSRC